MTKLLLATAALTLAALSAPVFAADLVVDEAPAAYSPDPVQSGLYVQLLGGASLSGTLEYTFDGNDDGEDDIGPGWAIAGVVGFGTGIDGLSIEGDAFYTNRDYSDDDYNLTTATLMADLKYTFSITDTVGLYAAIGLGGVYLHDQDNNVDIDYVDGWGAGYLLKAGITAQITDGIALVGELRYANSFSPIEGEGVYDDEQIGTGAALVGVHFGF
jgi:opacity protein-like surface antigen